MPTTRNTSSNGAPNRSATRLDRMPASTSNAPNMMVRLTASSAAIGHSRECVMRPAVSTGFDGGSIAEIARILQRSREFLSLPVFGEGRVGSLLPCSAVPVVPTRPRFARPPSPKAGRDSKALRARLTNALERDLVGALEGEDFTGLVGCRDGEAETLDDPPDLPHL